MRLRRKLGVGSSAVALGASLLFTVTGGAAPAHAAANPINHVVVLMQENRSYDTYLGQLHWEGQTASEAEPNTGNPDPTNPLGPPIKPFHKTTYCETADLDHSWNGAHAEWDNGLMDGFTKTNVDATDPTGRRTMGYYDQTDLPFYYALDNTFSVNDRYFQSTMTQTFPNRFYLLAGTSFGHIRNDFPSSGDGFSQKTIFENLDAAGITWKVYYSQIAFALEFSYVRAHANNVVPVAQYYQDAANGTLPQVSFVDPVFVASAQVENDEHPPSNVQVGEQFVAGVVNALTASPNWHDSALFYTYDENGGFYDHVAPPAAVVPDNIPPMLQAGDTPGAFDHYGFRVPFTVVSPYAKPHYVSHVVDDHT